MTSSPATESADDTEVMRLWRECGLPEYFLGNGGTNHKLVAFAKACRRPPVSSPVGISDAQARSDLVTSMSAAAARKCMPPDFDVVRWLRRTSKQWDIYDTRSVCLTIAATEIERLRTPTGAWRDIASAPKDGRWLHLFGDGPMFASCNFIGYFGKRRTEDHLPPNWWLCLGRQGDFSYCTPTHWQPLPPSPRVQDEGEKGGDAKRSSRSALSAELQDVLADIEQFLQDRHDIRDGVLGGPHPLPNQAMVLSSALKRALGEEP